MKNLGKILSIILSISLLVFCFAACGDNATTTADEDELKDSLLTTESDKAQSGDNDVTVEDLLTDEVEEKYTAVIRVKDYGEITVELDGKTAPITVANFVKLAKSGFYDGITFHRIIEGFMIQGGDPTGTGMGGSEQTIKGEFSANGVENNIKHVRGVISMARSSDMNSASSQFFIMHEDASHLDGQYAAFGKVTKGMDIVDALATKTPVADSNGTVLAPNQPVIESITIK